MKKFSSNFITKALEANPLNRVAGIVFKDESELVWQFSSSEEYLQESVDSMVFIPDQTSRADKGLNLALNQLFPQKSSFKDDVIVVIFDGISRSKIDDFHSAVEDAVSRGITIIPIAVQGNPNNLQHILDQITETQVNLSQILM